MLIGTRTRVPGCSCAILLLIGSRSNTDPVSLSLGWFDALITNDDNCSATIDELEARVPGLRQVISHLIENAIFKLFYNTVFVR